MKSNDIIKEIANLNQQQYDAFFHELRVQGFNDAEIRVLQEQAAYYKLFTDSNHYNAVMNEVLKLYANTIK